MVHDVCAKLRPLAEEKNQVLETDLPATIPNIAVDAQRLRQVLSNLIGNAIKFTPPEGRIRVSARVEKDVVVSVSDTGPGIPKENLSKIFDRFWQVPGTKHQGTGLGLSIAKGIIQSLGGEIWAESQVGKGTSFFITLPLADSDNGARPRLAA